MRIQGEFRIAQGILIMIKLGLVSAILLSAIGISAFSWHSQAPLLPFLLLSTIMFTAAAMPTWKNMPLSPWLVWGVALALHGIGLCGIPLFEDDYFRYLWDGYRTATSGTPYGPPPEAFFTDPGVPVIMRRILDSIGYPETPTIYGPVLQTVFWLSHLAAPGQERMLRAFFCLANLGLIALLLKRIRPEHVALYAWSPLAFKEIALSGHPDGLLALFLLLGLSARRGSTWLGVAFGLAAGVKLSALAAWPALLRLAPGRRAAGAGVAAAVLALLLAYLPFVRWSGTGASDLAGLAAFAAHWEFNAGPYALLRALMTPEAAKLLLLALGTAGILAVHVFAKRENGLYPFHLVFGCILLVSPVVNAWYLLWALPFACGARAITPWVASLALLLSYCSGQQLPHSGLAPFAVHPIALWLEWGMIAAAIAWDVRAAQLRNAL